MVRIYFVCVLCLFFFSVKAQPIPPQYGCMSKTSPTRVYQQAIASFNGLPTFQGLSTQYSEWTVQYDITNHPCVAWNPTQTSACYIKTGSGTSAGNYTLGDYGYFSGTAGTTECPLDSAILLLIIPVGFYAVYQVKKVRDENDDEESGLKNP